MNPVLRPLKIASIAEAFTLIILIFIAVPLKRLLGIPEAVSLVGPIHGFAFLFYVAMVLFYYFKGHVSIVSAIKLLVAAFVPFGAFFLASVFQTSK